MAAKLYECQPLMTPYTGIPSTGGGSHGKGAHYPRLISSATRLTRVGKMQIAYLPVFILGLVILSWNVVEAKNLRFSNRTARDNNASPIWLAR